LAICSHYRRGAGAGAAAHAGSDEHHVRAAQRIFDAATGFFRQLAADLRLHAGAQAAFADLDDVVRGRLLERLGIGIGDNEFHARARPC
jgi:hypothetical protein